MRRGFVVRRGSRVVRGRLQQRSWTVEDGNARQVVWVVAEELAGEPPVGDGDHDQDDARPESSSRMPLRAVNSA
jgi:single-stranded DNA-binding protein